MANKRCKTPYPSEETGEINVLIAGFGGQGVISAGKILARTALHEGRHTTYFPSYGAEVRGGTAHCFVKISDCPIDSPLIESLDIAIILNQPSWIKFSPKLKRGVAVVNSNLCPAVSVPRAVKLASLPLKRIAAECGDIRSANLAALGAAQFLDERLFREQTLLVVLREYFSDKSIAEANQKAFLRGRDWVLQLSEKKNLNHSPERVA